MSTDELLIDDRAEGRGRTFEKRGGGGDLDGFANLSDLKNEIDAGALVGLEGDAVLDEFAETGRFGGEIVGAGRPKVMLKLPSAADSVSRAVRPVSALVARTLALGMAAPEESAMLPPISPVETWAKSDTLNNRVDERRAIVVFMVTNLNCTQCNSMPDSRQLNCQLKKI
ncbi:MAG: hypothetical protein R2762_01620 [Bryobacteraceae bacterium]